MEFPTPFTRRRWLRAGALTLATSALVPRLLADSSKTFCTLSMGTYGLQSLSLREAIDLIAETGFGGLEITTFPSSTPNPATLSAEARKDLAKQIADTGLHLDALMVDLKPQLDDASHAKQLESLRELADLAHSLSPDTPPLLQTVLGGKDNDPGLPKRFAERMADWLPVAEASDVTIAIKPHRSHALSLPSHAIALLKDLGSPERVRMVYDYSHYAFRGVSIADSVAEALPWTAYVAVKDAFQQDDSRVRFALPGETKEWDHSEVLRAFYEGGYRGSFCCEVSSQVWKSPEYDAQAATEICHANMDAAFSRAEVPRRRSKS